MTNTQKVEPFAKNSGVELDFHSLWHTIQGEGPHTGIPAFFLRLAGCNLMCPWCDTEYTKNRRKLAVSDIARAINDLQIAYPHTRLLVITGGEPTRQRLDDLLEHVFELRVQIESNGVLAPTARVVNAILNGHIDYVVSPKTSHISHETRYAACFKYVLSADSIDPTDGLPIVALGHKVLTRVARPPDGFHGEIYVNPMETDDPIKNRQNLMACRDSALRFGHRLGVQLHKLVDLP